MPKASMTAEARTMTQRYIGSDTNLLMTLNQPKHKDHSVQQPKCK
jgi:hypothetical protein